ncbi:T-cell ecto-ADP-ribosyltransferase 1-like [Xiphias gladius]|uniref:T-cell ecto-ADP-ribosyltransferase 1-like n=1 Tax=Xiphias gladius TaxID=8245 RepID=UPI001A99DC0C|nr:T-cell ecto-ADP-ribosyltransferase 1-like [Xiphias gladius]
MPLFALLCSLLCWILPGDSVKIRFSLTSRRANQAIQMSMVKNAVDDMYFGCNQTMTKKVDKYFKKENTGAFAKIWKKAESCANKRLKHKAERDEALTKDHMQAICAYTSNYKQFYKTFNDHVRNNMSIYSSSFPFHALHFWLTSAVQILSNDVNCVTTYRRTSLAFTGEVNQIIRFGFFASSSYKTTLTHFGHKTCFEIKTCSGAFLKHYSYIGTKEEEVLIPPYEMFRITMGPPVAGLGDCGVVHILQSVGVQSNLNCKAAY